MSGPAASITPPPADALEEKLFRCLAVAAVLVFAMVALSRPPYADEAEHVHAGWELSQGNRPYVEFFEHHNPLYWAFLALLHRWLPGESLVFWAARATNVLAALTLAGCTLVLAARAGLPRRGRELAVLLLLMTPWVVGTLVDLRPDVPMTVTGTLCLVLAHGSGRRAHPAAAGLLLGLSFCFLQKAVFYWLALLPRFWTWWREGDRVSLSAFHAAATAPIAVMIAVMAHTSMLRNWWLLNFPLNAAAVAGASDWGRVATEMELPERFVVALGLLGLPLAWRTPAGRQQLAGPALLLGAAIGFARTPPFPQYFLPLLPLLAVLAALGFEGLRRRTETRAPLRVALLGLLLFAGFLRPVQTLALSVVHPAYASVFEKLSFVLANTPREQALFDPDFSVNLSRPAFAWDTLNRDLFRRPLSELGFPSRPHAVPDLLRLKPPLLPNIKLTVEEARFASQYYVRTGYSNLLILGVRAALGAGEAREVELLARGAYVLEASGPVRVDGHEVSPAAAARVLEAGRHRLENPGRAQEVTLRLETQPPAYRHRWHW